jgi:hypothetical protein
MNSLVHFLRYFHRLILIVVLLLTAITPIIFNETVYTFLYLPVFLIFIGILSMNIDNWLNKYEIRAISHRKTKITRKCIIKRGICCLHH